MALNQNRYARRIVMLLVLSLLFTSVLLMGNSTLAATPITLVNPGFETGTLSGWTNSGSTGAAVVQSGGFTGAYRMSHWKRQSYTAETVQTVTGLTNGAYTLSAYVQNGGGQTAAYLLAKNFGGAQKSANLPVTNTWTQVTISNIQVTNGQLTFGVYSNAASGNWISVDAFQLTYEDGTTTPPWQPPAGTPGVPPTSMLVGGDITYRNMITDLGGKWAYSDGTQADVLDILEDHAFNLARIRIYNEPGNIVQYNGGSYQLQPGYQDLQDAVKTAQAAKAHNMKLFISLHYSDFWTNPSTQLAPVDWKNYNQAQLEQATYDYTLLVMNTLKNNGVTPEYISIGNEINNAVMGVSRGTNYYKLLKKGYDAVKAVNPATKVVIHLTEPNQTFYQTWINDAQANGLNYDLMGVSAYPFWTNMSITDLANFVTWVANTSGKKVMICEVGYPWTLQAQRTGETTMIASNNLDPDGPENYGAAPQGQFRYMSEYHRAMYNTGKVEGISYWDPIWLDIDGAGWAVGGYNSVEDTTFFDYGSPHKALESLQAFYRY